jgi:hypothetical protein
MYLLVGVLTQLMLSSNQFTVAGQCWIFTNLSPLLQVAVSHLNQSFHYTGLWERWEMGDGRSEMGDGRWEMGDGRWEIGDGRSEMGDAS